MVSNMMKGMLLVLFLGVASLKAQSHIFKPDLVVSRIDLLASQVPVSQVAVGQSVTVSAVVSNDGFALAEESYVRFSLSRNPNTPETVLGTKYMHATLGTYAENISLSFTVPNVSLGLWYLIVEADYDNRVYEESETNNLSSIAFTIAVPQPDLNAYSPTLSTSRLRPGESLTASFQVQNLGTGNANWSAARFYLSVNTVFDSGDVVLNDGAVSALTPNQSQTTQGPLTIPIYTNPGTYYVLMRADYSNAILESNENNNITGMSLTVDPAPNVDLVATSMTLSASTVEINENFTLTATFRNEGRDASKATCANWSLSSDSVYSPSTDIPLYMRGDPNEGGILAWATVPALSPGQSTTVTITGTASHHRMVPGNYILFSIIDRECATTNIEANKANNLYQLPITVTVGLPDLVAYDNSVFNNCHADRIEYYSPITFLGSLRNMGGSTAAASSYDVYISESPSIRNAIFVGRRTMKTLLPDANWGLTWGDDISPDLLGLVPGRQYYVICNIDVLNQVHEADENNIFLSSKFTVEPVNTQPNLGVLSFGPSSAPAGSTISVWGRTVNISQGYAGNTKMRVYLSNDNQVSSNDDVLITWNMDPLRCERYQSKSQLVTLPSGRTGSWYLITMGDADHAITESNEMDNTTSVMLTIGSSKSAVDTGESMATTVLDDGFATAIDDDGFATALDQDIEAGDLAMAGIDGNGNQVVFDYDASGLLVGAQGSDFETWYVYNQQQRLVEAMDSRGASTFYSYDEAGLLFMKETTSAHGHVVRLTFDEQGRVVSREDALGFTDYAYDQAGNLAEVSNPNSKVTLLRDGTGRGEGYRDQYGFVTYYQVEEAGIRHLIYDPDGNLIAEGLF